MKKFFLIPFIVLSLVVSMTCPCYAKEQVTEYLTPQDEVDRLTQQAYDNMVAKYEGSNKERSTSSYEYKYEKVTTANTNYSNYRDAGGQPSAGTRFPTAGSGFFWMDSTYSPGSFSYGLSIGGKYVTIGISYQPGSMSNQTTAFFTEIGDDFVNKDVKLQVARRYTVTYYKVYRKIRTESTWTYISDEYPAVPIGQAFKVVLA